MTTDIVEDTDLNETTTTISDEPCRVPWDTCPFPGEWQQVCPNGHGLFLTKDRSEPSVMCGMHRHEMDATMAENPELAQAMADAIRAVCGECGTHITTPFIWRHL